MTPSDYSARFPADSVLGQNLPEGLGHVCRVVDINLPDGTIDLWHGGRLIGRFTGIGSPSPSARATHVPAIEALQAMVDALSSLVGSESTLSGDQKTAIWLHFVPSWEKAFKALSEDM